MKKTFFFAWLAVSSASCLRAGLPEPDNVVYGRIAVGPSVITAQRTNLVVEVRALNGDLLSSYRMGENRDFHDLYVVNIGLETATDSDTGLANPNSSTVGNSVIILVRELITLPRQPGFWTNYYSTNVLVSQRGFFTKIDFGISGYSEWEMANALATGSGNLDSDGDGVSNSTEYIAGTNPRDSGSIFTVNVSLTNSQAKIFFFARKAEGVGYSGLSRYHSLEYTTNLNSGFWVGVPNYTNILGANQTVMYQNFVTNAPAFFRGKVWLKSN